ncbi:MAG: hypothetical protein E5299_01440 [Burkholderia gladioli]|nr:MAG: hypothetical protein E5299_01440 [Burkholderia gladioli]
MEARQWLPPAIAYRERDVSIQEAHRKLSLGAPHRLAPHGRLANQRAGVALTHRPSAAPFRRPTAFSRLRLLPDAQAQFPGTSRSAMPAPLSVSARRPASSAFMGLKPQRASDKPTPGNVSVKPHRYRINSRTACRVHNANDIFSWSGIWSCNSIRISTSCYSLRARLVPQSSRTFAGVALAHTTHARTRQVCMLGNFVISPTARAQVDHLTSPLFTPRGSDLMSRFPSPSHEGRFSNFKIMNCG